MCLSNHKSYCFILILKMDSCNQYGYPECGHKQHLARSNCRHRAMEVARLVVVDDSGALGCFDARAG
jgi:hypothetical protein